jgi:phospholipid-binding lipoprotein MlaA
MRMQLRRAALCGGALIVAGVLGGCASAPTQKTPGDPLERVNRSVYRFNDTVDKAVARPAAKAYHDYVPAFMRSGISNAIDNLSYTTVIVNQLLQGKWGPAMNDTGRFLLNSTLGLGGLLDPASAAGLDRNDEDFGQTFGKWGVPTGPYLVVPILGPSTLRDAPLIYFEGYTDLRGYLGDWETKWALVGVGALDARSELLSVDQVLTRAYDPYVFMRDAYLQRREYQVRDGDVPEEELQDESLEDEPPMEDEAAEEPAEATPPE